MATIAKSKPAKKAAAKSTPTATAPTVLKLEHLTMRFGGLVAVDDLSFEARHGEITALIGPNGAGKTTVFNCITGFYKPTTGLISLYQQSGKTFYLDRMPDFRVCADAKVARTFQNIRLFSGMTILENLLVAQHNHLMVASGMTIFGMFGLPSYKRAEKASIEKAAYWLDKVGLTDRADDPAGDLPYGAQRRLEIARARIAENGHHQRGFAGTIGTDEGDDFALVHFHVHAFEGGDFAVEGLHAANRQEGLFFAHDFFFPSLASSASTSSSSTPR